MKNKKESARIEKYQKAALARGQIKVHVTVSNGILAGEYLWATPVGKNQARIDNIPVVADHIGKGDIVEVSASTNPLDQEYLRTIKRGSYTGFVQYANKGESSKAIVKKYVKLCSLLNAKGIETEACVPGFCAVAIPLRMGIRKAKQLFDSLPEVVSYDL